MSRKITNRVFLFLFIHTLCASIVAQGQVALPGGPCLVEAHKSWSDVEKWAWDRLCIGEVANLNERVLTNSRFTELVNLRRIETRRHVSFAHSHFLRQLWFNSAIIGGYLSMTDVKVTGALNMGSATIGTIRPGP